MTRGPRLKAPSRRPGSAVMTPRMTKSRPPSASGRRPPGRAARAVPGAPGRRRRPRRAWVYWTLPLEVQRAVVGKAWRNGLQLDHPRLSAGVAAGVAAGACHGRSLRRRRDLRTGRRQARRDRRGEFAVDRARARHDQVGAEQRPGFAGEHLPHALNDRAQRDDGADAERDAQEEEQQPPPRGAHLAHGHRCHEPHRPPPMSAVVSSGTGRPSRSDSRVSAKAAISASCVTSTSVTARAAAHRQEQLEDVAPVGAVEVARRLVGEDERRIVGERPGDGDTLLLAARELRRIVMGALGQTHFLEQRRRALARVTPPDQLHRHQHVLQAR